MSRPPFKRRRSERSAEERDHTRRRDDARGHERNRHVRRGAERGTGATRRTRMPPEEIPARHPQRGRGHSPDDSFTCGHCHRFVGPVPSGGHHRNHCPFCLYSRHVDARPGDRASACRSLMAPIGAFQRPNGEHVIVHRCLGCDFERFNRIAADDDFDLVLALPVMPARKAGAGLTAEDTEDTESKSKRRTKEGRGLADR